MVKGAIFLSRFLDEERIKKYFFARFQTTFSEKKTQKTHYLQAFLRFFPFSLFHVERGVKIELFHVKPIFFGNFSASLIVSRETLIFLCFALICERLCFMLTVA